MADVYDAVASSVFWSQLVLASPDEMGASDWKPGDQLQVRLTAPLTSTLAKDLDTKAELEEVAGTLS